jgi:hypothetical protein
MAYRAFCRFFCCQLRLELIFHLWSRSFERNELDWLVNKKKEIPVFLSQFPSINKSVLFLFYMV